MDGDQRLRIVALELRHRPAQHAAGDARHGSHRQPVAPERADIGRGTFQALQLYPIGALRHVIGSVVRLITGWTMLFLVALAAFFFLKISDQVSRGWLIGFYFAGTGALLAGREVMTAGVRYQFDGTEPEDITNATNWAPYPTLHLLREESIDRAVETYPDVDAIPERNMALLQEMGEAGWNKLGIVTRVSPEEWVRACPHATANKGE